MILHNDTIGPYLQSCRDQTISVLQLQTILLSISHMTVAILVPI